MNADLTNEHRHTLACPYHSAPLTRIGNSSYHCRQCPTPWIIFPDTSSNFRFNRTAPFAQLVIDADHILGAYVRQERARQLIEDGQV